MITISKGCLFFLVIPWILIAILFLGIAILLLFSFYHDIWMPLRERKAWEKTPELTRAVMILALFHTAPFNEKKYWLDPWTPGLAFLPHCQQHACTDDMIRWEGFLWERYHQEDNWDFYEGWILTECANQIRNKPQSEWEKLIIAQRVLQEMIVAGDCGSR